MYIIDENELMTIRNRLGSGELAGPDFGTSKPLRPDGLASAISRQIVGHGGVMKYKTPTEVAATLFYGLVQNHPFENGNKRTALVAMLVSLDKNRVWIPDATEDELYVMATSVAAHTFYVTASDERDPDGEVKAIAKWLKRRCRNYSRGDKPVLFEDLKTQLESLGCEFANPSKNFIKVYRETPSGMLSAKMGYPRQRFTVSIQDVKNIRKRLQLDEVHGMDSSAFYEEDLEGIVDHFVNTHRQLLDRLAEA